MKRAIVEVDVQPRAAEVGRGAHLGDRNRVRDAPGIAAQTKAGDRVAEHRDSDRADDPDQADNDNDLQQRESVLRTW